jgi:hypothetical protein
MNNDCAGLAAFADQMAAILGGNVANFVGAFAVLTPQVLGEQALGVSWNTNPVFLGQNQGVSGFASKFQDGYGTGAGPNASDQAHHFAAFFQAGFFNLAGATAAAYAFELFEGTPSNQGDINLGLAAAALGGLVSSGSVRPSDVGNYIRQGLCDK